LNGGTLTTGREKKGGTGGCPQDALWELKGEMKERVREDADGKICGKPVFGRGTRGPRGRGGWGRAGVRGKSQNRKMSINHERIGFKPSLVGKKLRRQVAGLIATEGSLISPQVAKTQNNFAVLAYGLAEPSSTELYSH